MTVSRASMLVALALVAGTSVTIDSIAGSGPIRAPQPWSLLPPRFRALVHPTVADIPHFAGEHDSLLQMDHWPKAWIFEGREYPLRLGERPGSYWAYYAPPGDDRMSRRRGPGYVWRPDSSLEVREFLSTSSTEIWLYDSGERLVYYLRMSSAAHPRSWLSCGRSRLERHLLREWFTEDGRLLGFEADGTAYWNGVPLSRGAYPDSLRSWQRWRDTQRGPFSA